MIGLNSTRKTMTIEEYWFFMLVIYFIKMALFSLGIESYAMNSQEAVYVIVGWTLGVAGILLLLMSFFMLLPRILNKYVPIAVDTVISGLIIANQFHSDFFHSYIPANAFFESGQGLSLYRALLSTFNPWYFMWLLTVPSALYLCINGKIQSDRKVASWRITMLFILAGLTMLLVSNAGSSNFNEERSIALKRQGLLPYYVRDVHRFFFSTEETIDYDLKTEKIKNWFLKNEKSSDGERNIEYFGKAEGKNVILLQIEALQNHVVFKEVNGEEVTPNINRIIRESIYYPYCYDQVERATADGETLANLSLYSIPDTSIYEAYPQNTFNSLANTLKDNGYEFAAAFHGHDGDFYNRENAYPQHGFDRYYSREDYKADELHNGLLGDMTFLKQTVDYLEALEQPFYAFIVTLTSHHPFNYYEGDVLLNVGKYEGTIVGDYLHSMHYVDAAVGEFYGDLKEKGLLEDSLLVMFGDHVAFNYNERNQGALKQFLGIDVQDPFQQIQQHFVPLSIRMPEKSMAYVDDQLAGQIDIYPTVANLAGVETEYLLGRDLINSEEEKVILRGGSFRKRDLIYYAPTREMKDIRNGEVWKVDPKNDMVREVKEELKINRYIYEVDFWNRKQ